MYVIPIVLFYDYKFLKMVIQGKCVSFYFYGSFFMITFFLKKWVYKENVYLFISMVLFMYQFNFKKWYK